jgi:predicted SAM-dependent methyltransferase
MYPKLKKIIVFITPAIVLFKFEFLFRKILSLFYYGNTVICIICNKKFSSFIAAHADDKMCPRCGSLGRHRRLWQLLDNEIALNTDARILDFSPSRIIKNRLKKIYPGYICSDYMENSYVDKKYDITGIPEEANSFQFIICYHILEHVTDDKKAISELFRILSPGGKAIIQTPFKEGDIYENIDINTPQERLAHFGQEDHVRIYSIPGLKERLENAGFKVTILDYKEEKNNIFGFNPEEHVFVCLK